MDPGMPKHKRARLDHCRICGDTAFYSFFGTISCQACKMFFKRYGNNQEKVPACPFDNQCDINLNTRHVCTACRLKKCLSSGMQAEKIRGSSNSKPITVNSSRSPHMASKLSSDALIPSQAPLPISTFRRTDSPCLTKNQWSLLTNLVHIHDLSNIYTMVNELNSIEQQTGQSLICRPTTNPIPEFLAQFYRTSVALWEKNADFQRLSINDRRILLPMVIDNLTCFAGTYVFAERRLYRNQFLVHQLKQMYGSSLIRYHYRTTKYVQCDDFILFKLTLALFGLSNVSRIFQKKTEDELTDLKSILEIEHRYAELLWTYLMYKYHPREALQRYLHIIRCFLAMITLLHQSHLVELHCHDMQKWVDEAELRMFLDEIDELTGTNT